VTTSQEYAALQRQNQQLQQKLRRQLLRDLFHGAPTAGSTLDEINEYYGYHFQPGSFNVLIIHLKPREPDPPYPLSTALEWVDSDARMFLNSVDLTELESLIEKDTVYLFLNFAAKFGSQEGDDIRLAVDRLYHHMDDSRRYRPFYFTLGDGLPTHSILDSGASLLSARNAVDEYGVGLRVNRHHDSGEQMYAMAQIMNVLTPVRRAWFAHYLCTGQMEALRKWVDEVFADCRPYLERFPTFIFQLPYKILDLCLDVCGDAVNGSTELQQILIDCRSAVDNHQKYDQLAQVVSAGLERFYHQYTQSAGKTGNPAVLQSQNFMWQNYMKKLTLDEIAGQVHLNPQYFSVLFKRETGESAITYLTNIRVEHAKLLLKDTSIPINEVARRVGYDDPDYFSRLFRKANGITPRQYRTVVNNQ
jgi:AraC-like DNA-binding protein